MTNHISLQFYSIDSFKLLNETTPESKHDNIKLNSECLNKGSLKIIVRGKVGAACENSPLNFKC